MTFQVHLLPLPAIFPAGGADVMSAAGTTVDQEDWWVVHGIGLAMGTGRWQVLWDKSGQQRKK